MQITVNIDDGELQEIIKKGIGNLSEETINGLAKEAISNFLQDKRVIEALVFNKQSYGYGGYDYSNPQQWFLDMISNSFTAEEVSEYRDKIYRTLEENRKNIIIETMANVFSKSLVNSEMQYYLARAMYTGSGG